MTSVPDPFLLALDVRELKTKVDQIITAQEEHRRALEELKGRRWPLGVATLAFVAIGSVSGVAALVVHR